MNRIMYFLPLFLAGVSILSCERPYADCRKSVTIIEERIATDKRAAEDGELTDAEIEKMIKIRDKLREHKKAVFNKYKGDTAKHRQCTRAYGEAWFDKGIEEKEIDLKGVEGYDKFTEALFKN